MSSQANKETSLHLGGTGSDQGKDDEPMEIIGSGKELSKEAQGSVSVAPTSGTSAASKPKEKVTSVSSGKKFTSSRDVSFGKGLAGTATVSGDAKESNEATKPREQAVGGAPKRSVWSPPIPLERMFDDDIFFVATEESEWYKQPARQEVWAGVWGRVLRNLETKDFLYFVNNKERYTLDKRVFKHLEVCCFTVFFRRLTKVRRGWLRMLER